MAEIITFDEYWIKKSININNTPHHPYLHYPGSSTQCSLCDKSLPTPEQEYNRDFPNGEVDGKCVELKIIEDSEDDIKEVFDKKTSNPGLRTSLSIFKDSAIWEKFYSLRNNSIPNINQIESAEFLKPKGLDGQNVLVLPHVGYTRSLSVLECLKGLEVKQNKPIHQIFDVINGNGYSSIIAASLAKGFSIEKIKEFWLGDWKKLHEPNFIERLKLAIHPKKKYGYSVANAKKKLSDFFKQTDDVRIQYCFKDLSTEVYLPSIYGRLKEGKVYSISETPNLPIVDALMDTALDPFSFDAKETVKGKGLPLCISDSELSILLNNKNVLVTKVESPLPHTDYGDLNNATHERLAIPERDKNNLIRKSDTDSFVDNFRPKRIKIECQRLPDQIPINSTDVVSIQLAIEAGKKVKIGKYDKTI